jgi:hypothetical protein
MELGSFRTATDLKNELESKIQNYEKILMITISAHDVAEIFNVSYYDIIGSLIGYQWSGNFFFVLRIKQVTVTALINESNENLFKINQFIEMSLPRKEKMRTAAATIVCVRPYWKLGSALSACSVSASMVDSRTAAIRAGTPS